MTIGERLRQLRKELKLTQVEFAARLKIKGQSVSKLEKGENSPSDQTIALICSEFGVNETWLRTGEGDQYPQPDTVSLDALVSGAGLSGQEADFARKFLRMFRMLKPETRTDILARFNEIFGEPERKPETERRNVHDWTPDEVAEEARRQTIAYDEAQEGESDESSTSGPGLSGMAAG